VVLLHLDVWVLLFHLGCCMSGFLVSQPC